MTGRSSSLPRLAPSRDVIAARRRRRAAIGWSVGALLAMLSVLPFIDSDVRPFAGPVITIAELALIYMLVLWARDGAPPVFEVGTLCMLAIAIYGMLPMVGFAMMDGSWPLTVDNRLFAYPFDAAELSLFGWRYALYAFSFTVTYLVVRGRRTIETTALELPNRSGTIALLAIFAGIYLVKVALKVVYDYDPEAYSYEGDFASVTAAMLAKPLFVRQIGHNIHAGFRAARLAVLVLLMGRWKRRPYRVLIVCWLAFEVVSLAVRMGPRTNVVLFLVSAGMLYHRLVRRVSFRLFFVAGTTLLAAFLFVGAFRSGYRDPSGSRANVLTTANEFQGLFTTAFDIYKRKQFGEIGDVPWQLYVSDFYLIIPSQILPFEKMEGSDWYINLIGATGSGVGYMFGVMAQAALGLDWFELVLRGAVLALCLALLHRWYVRHATTFWATVAYVFVSIWTYYTFRASTFYFVYFVVYHLVPIIVAAKLLTLLLNGVMRRSGTPPDAAAYDPMYAAAARGGGKTL